MIIIYDMLCCGMTCVCVCVFMLTFDMFCCGVRCGCGVHDTVACAIMV